MSQKIKPKDWVRFIRNNSFVIGQVEYVKRSVIGTVELQTDAGEVAAEDVLEWRRSSAAEDRFGREGARA